MSLTFGNYIFIFAVLIIGICIGIGWMIHNKESNGYTGFGGIITIVITFVICFILMFGLNWWNTSTASGIRSYKDYQSNLDNGITREIKITAEDGREIFYYEGKVDVELNHDDNYIKFESEEGKRYIVIYGITDTVKIIEK